MFKAIAAALKAWNKRIEPPAPEPLPEKVPDISEPVISFVRIVKENPRRFKCALVNDPAVRGGYVKFKDKQENKQWLLHRTCDFYGIRGERYYYYGFPSWMTYDEEQYVWGELSKIFTSDRRDRLHHLQRERMKRIYN